MAFKLSVFLTFLFVVNHSEINCEQNSNSEDFGNFAELAAELFQSQGGAQGLGPVVQGFMGSALSGMLTGGDSGVDGQAASNFGQVLRGLSNMVGPNAQGIDTNVLTGIMGMIGNSLNPDKKEEDSVDVMSLLSKVGSVLSQPGSADKIEQISGYVPMVMDFLNSMYGPEAKNREKRHSDHSWAFPPILERFHIFADHLMSSEFGKKLIDQIGGEKIVKIFSDESGQFSYDKFVELMENHSFRRHWIHMATLRIGKFIELYSDPKNIEKYATMTQLMINSFLSNQGFPKSAMLRIEDPTNSLAALIDFLSKKYLGTSTDSKNYITPVISYATNIFGMIKQESASRGGTEGISAKLADSINLEIIEPIARVNRAYRYLKKNPKCDRYVLCLVNQKGPETDSLPGLKLVLSKGTSFIASWALSSITGESMMDYVSLIMYENQCQKFFKSECSDYHDEEVRVTTEYMHNEL